MKQLITIIMTLCCLTQKVSAQHPDWHLIADEVCTSLVTHYWGASFPACRTQYYFNAGSDQSNMKNEWWWQAHAMDVVTDAYERTGDERWLKMYDPWVQGIVQHNYEHWPEDPWRNESVDDMEWIVITLIRMYETSLREKYLAKAQHIFDRYIITTWGPDDEAPWHGGLSWSTNPLIPKTKNACSNGPGAIIAAMLARHADVLSKYGGRSRAEYEHDVRRIYEWEKAHLFNSQTGEVYDNMGLKHIDKKVRTYNSGTFIAMATEMYRQTHDHQYIADAVLAADYVIRELTDPKTHLLSNVSNRKGGGDQGLFHGIFFRYMTWLLKSGGLSADKQYEYKKFLTDNALMAVSTLQPGINIFPSDWSKSPVTSTHDAPLTPHVTGCTLISAVCQICSSEE